MLVALIYLSVTGLLVTACLLLELSGQSLGPFTYIAVGVCLCVALQQSVSAFAAIIKRRRNGAWPDEESPLRRAAPIDFLKAELETQLAMRRELAKRLLLAHFDGQAAAEDVSQLDALAAEGWRVISTEPVTALHLRRGDDQRIFIPAAWINGVRPSPAER